MVASVCLVSWSANEVQALATKAARGGGAPAGQAASFGRAAVCHLMAGRSAQDLIAALAALPTGPIVTLPVALAQVLETTDGSGTLLSDLPSLAQSYADTLPFAHEIAVMSHGIELSIQTDKAGPRSSVRRLDLPDDLLALWNDLAARILVPESEASRLGGAGAGLTDND